ncbi:ndufa6 NADH-ubiquinone oxidoreductase subunit [Malassezia sp. CBS 17886]|nr:ndufa6 NADH-ubiquinone oxidoreductase subunit [Malassezia sp. CBS 17886]
MTTIPARLSRVSQISRSLEHARSRSRSLYRTLYRAVRLAGGAGLTRQAPEICALYPLDVSPALLRAKFRSFFEQNRDVTDVPVLDVLLLKGHQEYQEVMNCWKQAPHIMKWFNEEESFLDKFYATRDVGRGATHSGL